ncbi:uncharacterized protein BKA78DRAFT_327761 [Phyllosticta capitalensis]|uniref:uncharacterized protein n=1 Tax=Phyllosticta capitalensis TaxID=121624 RepID=UPI0031314660
MGILYVSRAVLWGAGADLAPWCPSRSSVCHAARGFKGHFSFFPFPPPLPHRKWLSMGQRLRANLRRTKLPSGGQPLHWLRTGKGGLPHNSQEREAMIR